MKIEKDAREFEDDGRTVADMDDVGPQSVLSGLFWFRQPPGRRRDMSGDGDPDGRDPAQKQGSRNIPEAPVSPEERRMWMLGAVRAALLVGLVYIGVLGGAIALMVLLWKR